MARRMTVSSSRLQSADLQHPESPRILVPDLQLLIFECTRLTFVPPDPIIVCPKFCLYPSLHIRRTLPSISSYPLHNPTSISRARPGKLLGGTQNQTTTEPEIRRTSSGQRRKPSENSERQKEGTPGSLQASRVNYTHINLSERGSVHLILTKILHLNSRTASCLVTLTRTSLATSDSRSTQLLTER